MKPILIHALHSHFNEENGQYYARCNHYWKPFNHKGVQSSTTFMPEGEHMPPIGPFETEDAVFAFIKGYQTAAYLLTNWQAKEFSKFQAIKHMVNTLLSMTGIAIAKLKVTTIPADKTETMKQKVDALFYEVLGKSQDFNSSSITFCPTWLGKTEKYLTASLGPEGDFQLVSDGWNPNLWLETKSKKMSKKVKKMMSKKVKKMSGTFSSTPAEGAKIFNQNAWAIRMKKGKNS